MLPPWNDAPLLDFDRVFDDVMRSAFGTSGAPRPLLSASSRRGGRPCAVAPKAGTAWNLNGGRKRSTHDDVRRGPAGSRGSTVSTSARVL